ncbi:FxSxx-COOH system tetratricopeptide repeat protein [Streptomyces sp. NPDC059467]|uniref:FxSxx-COOH system tetratricopeptide repeat protein n=1 Tax=Streptomyces sp. NPDC059467 TaxID=3346844 RepID=UPI0036BB5AAF
MSSFDEKDGRAGRIVTFYSFKGGTGRTMALANVAWILAANGKRVLAVDWDLEAPGLHRFFHPFLDPSTVGATTGVIDMLNDYAWVATDTDGGPAEERPEDWHLDNARIQRHAVSLDWSFPDGGTLDLVTAGRQTPDYSSVVATFDWDNFYDRLGGGLFFDALRDDMRENYDYVLIDSRTGFSDIADICTAHLPDVLVDCFTLSNQSIDGAAQVARDVHERFRRRRIDILPVPMRIDEGEKEMADVGRALARERFAGFPSGLSEADLTVYWGAVEVPYRPYYAYEETLAVFGDEPGLPTSMLAAFERLAGVISGRAVTALPRMDDDVRRGIKQKFKRTRSSFSVDLHISYVSEDRMWAEWIAAQLSRAGLRALLKYVGCEDDGAQVPADRAVVILSPAYRLSPRAERVLKTATGHDPTGRRQVVVVRVGDIGPTPAVGQWAVADMVRDSEEEASHALLRALGKQPSARSADGKQGTDVRFPYAVPRFWNGPPRNASFTGRSGVLEDLRDVLSKRSGVAPVPSYTLYGLGGVGKTQIALEYTYRFAADYDVVWWIPAEQSELIVSALADLAPRLGLRTSLDAAQAAQEVREHLEHTDPTLRWLLVFDNADEPEQVKRYFPRGGGHVLVTSRFQSWQQHGGSREIESFLREEGVEHLLRRVPGLTAEDADRVAAAVGDLPLAVEQAGAWLAETGTPVARYLRALNEQTERILSLSRPAHYPESVGATWNVSIERVRERFPAAVRLLQLCAFFAAEPISHKLLYSSEMIRVLAAEEPSLQETTPLSRVIRELGRFALVKENQGTKSIQVHRLVQIVVRSQLTPREQEEARHIVHRILVAARPPGDAPVDDQENQGAYAEIWPHLDASGAATCEEPETRPLLIDRVRHLWRSGDLDTARALGEQLRKRWEKQIVLSRERIAALQATDETSPGVPGDDHAPRTLPQERHHLRSLRTELLYLRFQIANVMRSLGKYTEAVSFGSDTLADQRELLPPRHWQILMTASALAADLGAVGRLDEALKLADEAYLGFKQEYGEDDLRTLAANNNRALCLRLLGRYQEAGGADQEIYSVRKNALGARHPHTLASQTNRGRDLRETGEYEASVSTLRDGHERYKDLLGETHPETLRTAKSLAVSLRMAGRVDDARTLTTQTYEHYRQRNTPPTTPDVLDCALNLAMDLYATGAPPQEALRQGDEVVRDYRKKFEEMHPARLAAVNNLGILLNGAGETSRARTLLERNFTTLRQVLGDGHPYTLACALNLANTLAELDEPHRAEELERLAIAGFQAALGPRHPDSVVARANLSVTLRSLHRTPEADPLQMSALADLVKLLGEEHPRTVKVREGKRVDRDLEPPTI